AFADGLAQARQRGRSHGPLHLGTTRSEDPLLARLPRRKGRRRTRGEGDGGNLPVPSLPRHRIRVEVLPRFAGSGRTLALAGQFLDPESPKAECKARTARSPSL